jgi:H+/gluconate symporter-like permease
LIFLAYKGNSIVWVAPFCAVIVAILGGVNILDAYMGDYIKGTAEYIISWFPAFFLGAVYGKVMDDTGAARSLGAKLVEWIGEKNAMLAVVLPCMLMTYGGISLFVVVFVIYPMGYAIYRAADIPRFKLPGAIAAGAFGITMTAIPGTPQIQNLIPMQFYGTEATAAPALSIVSCIVIGLPALVWLQMDINKGRKQGLHFEEDPLFVEPETEEKPSWHWLSGLLPIIAVIVLLNVIKTHIVVALLGGIIVCCLMNIKYYKVFLPAFSKGADGSLTAIMNTSLAVGFGSVVKTVPGFAILTEAMLNMPGSILFSEAVAVNVLAGATGSASGGMSIALTALAPKYLEIAQAEGIDPGVLHRIASISSGGLDTLPHNGAVLTLLAVAHCTHKQSYWGVCVTTCIIPVVASLGLALVWGLFL